MQNPEESTWKYCLKTSDGDIEYFNTLLESLIWWATKYIEKTAYLYVNTDDEDDEWYDPAVVFPDIGKQLFSIHNNEEGILKRIRANLIKW